MGFDSTAFVCMSDFRLRAYGENHLTNYVIWLSGLPFGELQDLPSRCAKCAGKVLLCESSEDLSSPWQYQSLFCAGAAAMAALTLYERAELLERIREIRASERRSYQKITDIIAAFVELAQLSGPVPGVLAGPAFRAADGGLDLGALAGELEDVTLAPSR